MGGEVRRVVSSGPARLPQILRLELSRSTEQAGSQRPSVAVGVEEPSLAPCPPVAVRAGRPVVTGPSLESGPGGPTRAVHTWLGLDLDPTDAVGLLEHDAILGPLVARRPGLAIPGSVNGGEVALRTVLGQQVSVAAARTLTARLVALLGVECGAGLRRFPEPASIVAAGVDALRSIGLTGSRAATVVRLAAALDDGLDLSPGAERAADRVALGALRGIGPWTVEYVALRAMRDRDAFPAHDLVVRQALGGVDAREAVRMAEAWRPWRGLAAQHLWRAAALGELVGPTRP